MKPSPAFFITLNLNQSDTDLPEKFTLYKKGIPHPLCLLAIQDLQHYLNTQQEWKHNFGLTDSNDGLVVGKMFGVLVVQTTSAEIGYLSAFSGKLAGTNTFTKFVPPIFDLLGKEGFLKPGMESLAAITHTIKELQHSHIHNAAHIIRLKAKRKRQSVLLQQQIFEQYHFMNKAGASKNVFELFAAFNNPPAGSGECAGPKLLQYAFQEHLKPLAMAEFWWGQSPKSDQWKHGEYYACCKEKCEPILAFMLQGVDD